MCKVGLEINSRVSVETFVLSNGKEKNCEIEQRSKHYAF